MDKEKIATFSVQAVATGSTSCPQRHMEGRMAGEEAHLPGLSYVEWLPSFPTSAPFIPIWSLFATCSLVETFQSQNPFALLKIIEDPTELWFMWIIAIDVFYIN